MRCEDELNVRMHIMHSQVILEHDNTQQFATIQLLSFSNSRCKLKYLIRGSLKTISLVLLRFK